MFELLSGLAFSAQGDDSGIPALAYLYKLHLMGSGSTIASSIKGRIAASVGKMEEACGISQDEANRWRGYGPPADLIANFLGERVGFISPVDLSSRLPISTAVESGELETIVASDRVAVDVDRGEFRIAESASFPMIFQFASHGLENVSGYFDFHLITGPIIVDWSGCDRKLVDEAIESGAITPLAKNYERGIIYFNNGAYVDAVFEGVVEGGHKVEDVIYELFRISMAGCRLVGINPAMGPGGERPRGC
jgi:hypothetical protein